LAILRYSKVEFLVIAFTTPATSSVLINGLDQSVSVTHRDQGMKGITVVIPQPLAVLTTPENQRYHDRVQTFITNLKAL